MENIINNIAEILLNEYVIILVTISWVTILLFLLLKPRKNSNRLNSSDQFYESLSTKDQKLFEKIFVNINKNSQVLFYEIGKDNLVFFHNVEEYLYQYRDQITASLAKSIFDYAVKTYDHEKKDTFSLFESKIKILYYLRHRFPEVLPYIKTDIINIIQSNPFKIELKDFYSYIYLRLVMILEISEQYEEGVFYCKKAIDLQLNDDTVHGFEGRLLRLQKKLSH